MGKARLAEAVHSPGGPWLVMQRMRWLTDEVANEHEVLLKCSHNSDPWNNDLAQNICLDMYGYF
jgi:hypothetical protein